MLSFSLDYILFISSGDPLIISHPESQTSLPGEVVTFSVEATGTSPLHFRWLHDGNVVKGETNVLTLAGVRKTDSGRYLCQVENQSGMRESNPAKLCVGRCGMFIEVVFSQSDICITYSNIINEYYNH